MAETIDRLRQEHRDLARLLDILESQLAVFDAAGTPDYELMEAIADYFLDYPAVCHHPKEDLVYKALLVRKPDAESVVGDVEAEHVSIAELVKRFALAVRNVAHDAEISREAFLHVIRHFVEVQRKHIDREEGYLFPLAVETLTDADWMAIDGRIQDRNDPLFGAMPEERFATLRGDIEAWEEDSRT